MKIEIITGSPRRNSVTFRIALFLQQYLTENTSHEVGILDAKQWNLPPLQTVFSSIENTPHELKPLSERMFSADAFILVSPEYNGSYSTTLKNLLDHYPKQYHKPFGVVTGSTGAMGGIRAAQQMQLLVVALFGIGSPYMLIVPHVEKKFDAQGKLIDEAFYNNAHNFISEFLWLAESLVESRITSSHD
jgi:NAD(P)H-dependent FMN reductase